MSAREPVTTSNISCGAARCPANNGRGAAYFTLRKDDSG